MEKFLSTPSARRATVVAHEVLDVLEAISIHALREEGDVVQLAALPGARISIHALREEGDPTPMTKAQASAGISIHALREEGDDDPDNRSRTI